MLQLLETFCVVAEAGSLTRAAERLHITQPAISRQMRALERDLGAVLLNRTPQGISLTPVGRAVLTHAHQAVAAIRACRQVASGEDESAGRRVPRLVIAVGLMASLYVLPPVLARFRVLHPEVELDLQPAPHQIALSRLLDYAVDVAVLASPVRSALVRATPVLHDPLLLVSAPGDGTAAAHSRRCRGARCWCWDQAPGCTSKLLRRCVSGGCSVIWWSTPRRRQSNRPLRSASVRRSCPVPPCKMSCAPARSQVRLLPTGRVPSASSASWSC